MPVPAEYQRASQDFAAFLVDVRDEAGLWSSHAAYTMAEGVFRVFRRRVRLAEAIAFAGILPAGLRALFVADWDTGEPVRPFEDRAAMTAEVRALRPAHNFATETAIREVAVALRRHVDEAALERVLARCPEGARAFWQVGGASGGGRPAAASGRREGR